MTEGDRVKITADLRYDDEPIRGAVGTVLDVGGHGDALVQIDGDYEPDWFNPDELAPTSPST